MIDDPMRGWKITLEGFSVEVPNRRLTVRRHLELAALAALGSEAETYHLQAAIAEALAAMTPTSEGRTP